MYLYISAAACPKWKYLRVSVLPYRFAQTYRREFKHFKRIPLFVYAGSDSGASYVKFALSSFRLQQFSCWLRGEFRLCDFDADVDVEMTSGMTTTSAKCACIKKHRKSIRQFQVTANQGKISREKSLLIDIQDNQRKLWLKQSTNSQSALSSKKIWNNLYASQEAEIDL